MTVAITENLRYRHLNADKSHRIKVGGSGLEKEMVVDITITTENLSDSTVGSFVADFTQVNFKQVYLCHIIESDDLTDLYQFTEASQSNPATPEIAVKELATGLANSSASYTATLKAVIRGV
jgi:hypothetical protein